MIKRILFYFLILFSSGSMYAQDFYPEISNERYTIEGTSRQGFSSIFAYSIKDLEKGWWKYSRQFGHPLNMKDYYKVSVPSDSRSERVAIVLLSKTIKSNQGSKFFLTFEREGLPKEKLAGFNEQVNTILENFKQTFYLERITELLEKQELKTKKWSKKVDKARGGNKKRALDELKLLESEIDQLKMTIKEVYEAY